MRFTFVTLSRVFAVAMASLRNASARIARLTRGFTRSLSAVVMREANSLPVRALTHSPTFYAAVSRLCSTRKD